MQLRQGDVYLKKVRRREVRGKDLREHGRVILAHGEVTGHAHEIQREATDRDPAPPAQFFEDPNGKRYLFVDRPCALVHQEHGPIALVPGCYEVRRQREYSPEAIRNVED